jgi:thiol-disulfide isomerase/thioredoxin
MPQTDPTYAGGRTDAEGGERKAGTSHAARRGLLAGRRLAVAVIVAFACAAAFVGYAVSAARSRPVGQFPVSKLTVLPKGTPAPGFRLARLGGGPEVELASFRGRPTVVNFFASWCTDCRAELHAFGQVSRAYSARVHFVGVDTNDSNPQLAQRLLAAAGDRYPVGLDPKGVVASSKYSIAFLPVSVFLNAKGDVVGETYGAQTVPSLTRWMRHLDAGSTGT